MSVYFIQQGDDGPIKVGLSWSPQSRLAHLQVANPSELRIIGQRRITEGDPRTIEGQIHDHLRPWHIRNEWFEASDEVLEFVRHTSDPERTTRVFAPVVHEELSDEERYQRLAAHLRAAVGDAA